MTLVRSDLTPVEPHERQAVGILLLAKGVAGEIDVLRHALADPALDPALRLRRRAELADSLDRLCNLISLALAEIGGGANAGFSDNFQHTVDEVRGRLFQLSVAHMLEKLQRIHSRAVTAMKTRTYPLGLAARLSRVYGAVAENITALGGDQRLGEAERRFLEQTLADIRALAEIEATLFHIVDFAEPPPPAVTAPPEPPPDRTPPPSTHGYRRSWGW